MHTPVAMALHQAEDLAPFRFFPVVLDIERANRVPIERKPAERLELGPFYVKAEEVDESRRLRALEDVAERDRRELFGAGLGRALLPAPQCIDDPSQVQLLGHAKRHAFAGFTEDDL